MIIGRYYWMIQYAVHNGKVGGHVSTFLKMKVEVR